MYYFFRFAAGVFTAVSVSLLALDYATLSAGLDEPEFPPLLSLLDFNGPHVQGLISLQTAPAVFGSIAAISIGASVARALASDMRILYGSLLVFHGFCFVRRRSVWYHFSASLLALAVSVVIRLGRALFQLYRWRRSLDQIGGTKAGRARPENPRVMVLYANVGSGHKRAAQAIVAALRARGLEDDSLLLLDAMDLCPLGFRYVMQHLFQKLTQSLAGQHALGFLYDVGDHARKAKLQRFLEDFALLELVEKIAQFRPDAIVSTHFLPAQISSTLRRLRPVALENVMLSTVVTDLDIQTMWLQKHTDKYFVPRPDAGLVLASYLGVSPTDEKIVVSGIPIMPGFAVSADAPRAKALATFDVDANDPRPVVVLISSGKWLLETYQELLQSEPAMRVIVVTGRQKDVRSKLETVEVPPRHSAKLLGFVKEMPDLLRCADLLIGKAGGLTIAEAAALAVPMIVLDPIPGQETRNADVLLEAGAAVKLNSLSLLRYRIRDILAHNGARRERMKKAIVTLARANSCHVVAETLFRDFKESGRKKLN